MLEKLRNLAYKYAIPAAIVIALIGHGLMLGFSGLFSLLPKSLAVNYIDEIVNMLFPVGIAIILGFAGAFKEKGFLKGLICGITLLALQTFTFCFQLIIATGEPATQWKPAYLIVYGVISIFGVALREECIFRVSIQGVLSKKYANSTKGIWTIAIVSGIIFGLIHALNAFMGVELVPAIIQAVTNIGTGLFFAAVYLRGGNVWSLVLIHTVVDLAGLFKSVFCNATEVSVFSSMTATSLIAGAVFALIAIFLLRPSKCKEVLARFNSTTQVNEPKKEEIE